MIEDSHSMWMGASTQGSRARSSSSASSVGAGFGSGVLSPMTLMIREISTSETCKGVERRRWDQWAH